jgi:hypothetical protein
MAALRPLRGEARPALPAWSDRTDQNTLADFVAAHAITKLFNYAHRLVPDDESRFHRIFAPQNVKIGAANRRQSDSNDGLANANLRSRNFFHADIVRSAKNIRPHCVSRSSGGGSGGWCWPHYLHDIRVGCCFHFSRRRAAVDRTCDSIAGILRRVVWQRPVLRNTLLHRWRAPAVRRVVGLHA